MPPSSSSLTPKPPALLRVSESQAISNSSSFISSTTSSSSLFDRISGASSGCLTDLSSPFTPSTAEFKEQAFLPSRGGHDRGLSSSQSRLSQSTNVFLSSRLDRARALESRSSTFSHRQNKTPFVSLIPRPVIRNENGGYHPAPDSEDIFDAFTILRNRVEQGNPTVATRRALKIMDTGGRPPAAGLNGSAGGAEEASLKVVVTGPESTVEDWSRDFESSSDAKFCSEPSTDVNLCTPENDNRSEIAAAHSSIIFPSASDRSLFDEVERDFLSSAMPPKFSVRLPSKPVLKPAFSDLRCSPFMLATPDLSPNWEGSSSSLSTLTAKSPPSQISSPANMSFDEEEIARIMSTVISFPTRSSHLFPGSPQGDVDAATVMRVEIASTLRGDRLQPHVGQVRTLIGLGVALPVIHPPLPPAIFPSHHLSDAPLDSRSLQGLSYQSFDDRMFEVEQTSLAPLSGNVNQPSLPENEIDVEMDEVLLFSPLEGCPASTPLLADADFECYDAFQVEPTLSLAHTSTNHTSRIVSGKVLVGLGLGLDNLTESSVESQALPPEPSPTTGRHDLSGDESIIEGEVSLPPVTDFYLQVQKSLNLEPLGVQKIVELDASQLEKQSALYNLEHSDLLLDHIFSHSPPVQLEKKNEIERQLLANLFKKKPCHRSKSQKHDHNLSSHPCTLTTHKVVKLGSVKQSRSYQTLKKFGLERLAIFQPRSGRDDLNPPSVRPQDDPRSPNLSTRAGVFLTFSSLNAPSSCPTKSQSSGSVSPMEEPGTYLKYEASSKAKKNMQIGLGLPSRVVFRRKLRLQETSSSQGNVDAIRCQSRRSSQEFPNPSFIVTEPSFNSSVRVQSAQSSNQFLKPSQFTQRSLFDIVEVPTPPSSTSSPTPSPRHQWSPPFVRLNVPQKRRSPRSQLSTPSVVAVSSDTEVEVTPVDLSHEIPVTPAASSARRGFKRLVSKFARGLFKRSRTLKPRDLSSPVVIEHADAPPGPGLLRQGASCPQLQVNGLTSSMSFQNLQVLF